MSECSLLSLSLSFPRSFSVYDAPSIRRSALSLIGSEWIITSRLIIAATTYLLPNNERRRTCFIGFRRLGELEVCHLFVTSSNAKVMHV